MKSPTKTTRSTKPESIEDIFANVRPVEETLRELRDGAGALDTDPVFIADGLKIRFVHNILSAMRKAGITKSELARKLGKSRQYVGRVLDEEEGENFTLETMAAFACAVGLRLEIAMPVFEAVSRVVTATAKTDWKQAPNPGGYTQWNTISEWSVGCASDAYGEAAVVLDDQNHAARKKWGKDGRVDSVG